MIALPLLALVFGASVATAAVPAPITPAVVATNVAAAAFVSAGAVVTEQAVAPLTSSAKNVPHDKADTSQS